MGELKITAIVMGVAIFAITIFWLFINPGKKESLPVAPDMHMMIECDSFRTSLHIFNVDSKTIMYSYRVYVDINDNQLLDSSDVFLYAEENIKLRSLEEHQGMIMSPLDRYRNYSLLTQLTTDKLIEYYLSIPCGNKTDLSPDK